jgi:hypothetical protein
LIELKLSSSIILKKVPYRILWLALHDQVCKILE